MIETDHRLCGRPLYNTTEKKKTVTYILFYIFLVEPFPIVLPHIENITD